LEPSTQAPFRLRAAAVKRVFNRISPFVVIIPDISRIPFFTLSMKLQHLLALLLLPLLAASVRAADAPAYDGKNWAFLDSAKALQAADGITAAKYPDSDEATVEEKNVDVYQPDGTAQNQDEAFLKVLTEKGKDDRRTLVCGYLLPYFTAQVVKLEVIRGGQVIPVDIAANSTTTIDDSQMEENIYDPNSKVLLVNIPDLQVGDVVHSITRTTTMRSIIPGEFADENLFESAGYIRHIVYECHAPAAKPLKKIIIKDPVPGTVKYTKQPGENNTVVHRWEVSNVPRMFEEPSMPPLENCVQRILVSTTPSWTDVSKWYWNLSKPHLDATSDALKKTVASLTAGATTNEDKMKALFYFVSQKIRYMGLTPEKDRPGYEPHDVCITLDKQYGVCRDKAALLVEMLRTAGLEAYPVLVNVGSLKDQEVPDPNFNHAIVGVDTGNRNYVLLDPTDQHARDLQPWYDGYQSYLVCRPEGETIHVSAFASPDDNLMRITTSGTLSASGRLEAKSVFNFDGANDDIYRNGFSSLKPDDLRRYFAQTLRRAIPGARLKSLTVTPENMMDVSQPIQAVAEFTVDDMIATGHGKSIMSVPWIGNNFGLVNKVLDGSAGLDKRKYAMRTRVACGLDERASITLSGDFATLESIPNCPSVKDKAVTYNESFAQKGGTLECARSLKLNEVEFAPPQYVEIKQTLKEMGYDSRKRPVLALDTTVPTSSVLAEEPTAAPPVDSNATILSSDKSLDITDAHSAVYRVKFTKRILTYQGKIKEAEIKFPFNPACQEAQFIKGVVTSKSGQRQEISKGEMNVMDSDDSASAKRYTGGKIFVANLPGVDVGSTIEVEFEIRMKNMPFIGGFEPFQLPDGLEQKTFTVTAPAGLDIKRMVTGAAPLDVQATTGSDGQQIFTWSAKNISALPAEEGLPPDWVYKPGVNYFAGNFNAYLKDLSDTMEDRSQASDKTAALAKQLVAKAGSKLDAVQAIRDYVSRSIRLAGPSFTELPLKELSNADTTLTDGYGHAADRAILLHAMLAAAGFKPQFILASDLPAADGIRAISTSFPMPDSFDTPIVKVDVDGQSIYLNDTDQYAHLGSTTHDDRLGIDLATQSTQVIAAAKDSADRVETNYSLAFGANGKLLMDVQKHYFGNDFNEKSRVFAEMRPEEKKRYFQEEVSRVGQGARPVGGLTEQFDSYPGIEKFSVELDNYAVVDGKYLYFDLPFTPTLIPLPGGDHRTLPLMLPRVSTAQTRAEITLPPGFKNVLISPAGENLDAPSGGGKATITTSSNAGKYVLTEDSEIAPVVISASDYPAMQKLEATLEKKSGQVFLLEKD